MNVKLNSKTRHNLKNMNPKNSKKSPIHENADANITCDFGDGDISRSRSFLSNTCTTGANGRTNPHSHVDFLNLIIDKLVAFVVIGGHRILLTFCSCASGSCQH